MDVADASHFHGFRIDLRSCSGARAFRVIHPPRQAIAEHRHDWPCLTIQVLGGCLERWDGGEAGMGGPSAVLNAAGGWHANQVEDDGLETVSIQFDPDWLTAEGYEAQISSRKSWLGGCAAAEARALAKIWTRPKASDSELAQATGQFLVRNTNATPPSDTAFPKWTSKAVDTLLAEEPTGMADLARSLGFAPGQLARVYRNVVGEGLRETARNRRISDAIALLRQSEAPLAQVALDAGFCDQSHLHRVFQATLGRTPSAVRDEGRMLREARPFAQKPVGSEAH